MKTLLASIILTVALAGCSTVKPYQREVLADRAMAPSGEALEDHFRQHWQESREGGAGGYASAGGGCGCN